MIAEANVRTRDVTWRRDGLFVAAAVVLFVVLHGLWFFGAPADLDAFNFSLGVRDFDVTRHQPHPPGAPVYIAAGKAATWAWLRLGLPVDEVLGPEASALTALSMAAGALAIVLVWAIARRLAPGGVRACRVAWLTASLPLIWLLGARPMSDLVGLTMVLGVFWELVTGRLWLAAVVGGLAIGVRVQTGLLILPAVGLAVWRQRSAATALSTAAWLASGVLAWLVPLVIDAGGLRPYWAAVDTQAADDLASPIIWAATPTIENATGGLFNTFVRPWGAEPLAWLTLAAAAVGCAHLYRTAPSHLRTLLVCAVPYALFHLVFQETATTRYALPLVMAMVALATIAIETVPRTWQGALTVVLVGTHLAVAVPATRAFHEEGTPASKLFRAMYARAAAAPPAFVTGHWNLMLHRLDDLVIQPPWRMLDPAPGLEWQGPIDNWMQGSGSPVWFVADPRRIDWLQFDRRARTLIATFNMNEQADWLLRGVRPKHLDWWELTQPAWIALEGFALTPESGGRAAARREGPAFEGATALVRRAVAGGVIAIGGRHVGEPTDSPADLRLAIDGREHWTGSVSARERRYTALVHVRAEDLAGPDTYAMATIRSTAKIADASRPQPPVTVEQFDFQPADRVVMALTKGWHEPELDTVSGRTWRWSGRRAHLRVHRPHGQGYVLRLDGLVPPEARTARITVSANGSVVRVFEGNGPFAHAIVMPATDPGCDEEIVIESDFSFVPHERDSASPDRRELALRMFDIHVAERVPMSASTNAVR